MKQRARLEQLETALKEREGKAQGERQMLEGMQKQLADAQRDLEVRRAPLRPQCPRPLSGQTATALRRFPSFPMLRRRRLRRSSLCQRRGVAAPSLPVCFTLSLPQHAKRLNVQFEAGQYGLPESMRDQRKLRADAQALQQELEKMVHERNALLKKLDGTGEEIRFLRKKAGVSEDAPLDMRGFRSEVQAETAQLRALNAQLEREVSELEEERRRLRNELRFRAKWQGAHAARLGLSARQLQALEEYADALREGKRAALKAARTRPPAIRTRTRPPAFPRPLPPSNAAQCSAARLPA